LPPVAAFDIETIPDVEAGRRLSGFEGSLQDVADRMQAQRLADTDGRTDFLKSPYHRIVTISVAWLDLEAGKFKLDSLGDDPLDEGALLAAFFRILALGGGRRPVLVSWNGSGFDLPVMKYRALLHGIDASAYYGPPGQRAFEAYDYRFGEHHIDLMDALSGFGASDRMGLDAFQRLAGLPGKTVTEGHRVYQHIARGEWDVVTTYCELDALGTLLLYLLWQHSRRRLGAGGFAAARDLIVDTLAGDARTDVQTYLQELAAYEPGRTRRALAAELG